ncbi:MAG: hypothetical protein ACOX9B_00245 [Candidatus Xenobium sp.]|jgi:hypothetical protein|nr:hypothetical protein [Burkholderiales bacterium]
MNRSARKTSPLGPTSLPVSRREALQVALWVALMMLAFVAGQVWWEGHTELVFPDYHSTAGNDGLSSAWDYYELFTKGQDGTTGRSICNPVTGAAMAAWGPEVAVARLSQVPFILGVIVLMAGIGWRFGRSRGAILLALGVTLSPWAWLFIRNYTRAPVSMFAVAATIFLLLISRNLTRPAVCTALGLAMGLGWLADLAYPLILAPMTLIVAGRGLWSSRRSVFSLLVLLATLVLLAVLMLDYASTPANRIPLPDRFVPLVVMDLWAAALLICLGVGRSGPWTPGTGLAVSVSLGGLLASPYLLYYREVRIGEMWVAQVEWNSPFLGGFWSFEACLRQYVCWLNGMTWGGLLWVVVGALLLAAWKPTRTVAWQVGLGALGTLAVLSWFVPPVYARYLAPYLPMFAILAFLWAARWKTSYIACLVFMLVAGPLQVLGNTPLLEGALARAGLSGFLYDHPWYHSRSPHLNWRIPSVRDPMPVPSVLNQIPRGAKVGLLLAHAQEVKIFQERYLQHHFRVDRLLPAPRLDLKDLEYVVVIAPASWELPPDPRLRLLQEASPHPSFPPEMEFPRVYRRIDGS